jgi:hypothetical protein
METTLHRQLKALYAGTDGRLEQPVEGFRIDVVRGDELIEIQHGRLAAIRPKVACLLATHRVRVVKPLVARKRIFRLEGCGEQVASVRYSPHRGSWLDLFHELVHWTRLFPHPRLTLETILVEIEEWRTQGHGRRRQRRRRKDVVADQRLIAVREVRRLSVPADLWGLLPETPAPPFHTGHLAASLGVPRWVAQRVAYCLRQTGAAEVCGKTGRALVYRPAA